MKSLITIFAVCFPLLVVKVALGQFGPPPRENRPEGEMEKDEKAEEDEKDEVEGKEAENKDPKRAITRLVSGRFSPAVRPPEERTAPSESRLEPVIIPEPPLETPAEIRERLDKINRAEVHRQTSVFSALSSSNPSQLRIQIGLTRARIENTRQSLDNMRSSKKFMPTSFAVEYRITLQQQQLDTMQQDLERLEAALDRAEPNN